MIIVNRKGIDISIDGICIGDTVFKDNKEFKVIGFDIFSYGKDDSLSILLNGYSELNDSINELICIEDEDMNNCQFWNIIYDEDYSLDYNLWVSRSELKTIEEIYIGSDI